MHVASLSERGVRAFTQGRGRTVTSDKATLHAVSLADQNWRSRARSLHVLVTLEQKVAHTLASLRRLAQMEAKLLHSLESGEGSLGHLDEFMPCSKEKDVPLRRAARVVARARM